MNNHKKINLGKIILFSFLILLILTLTGCSLLGSEKNKTYKITKGNNYIGGVQFEMDSERIVAVTNFKDSLKMDEVAGVQETIFRSYKVMTRFHADDDIEIHIEGTQPIKYQATCGEGNRKRRGSSEHVYKVKILIEAQLKGNKLVGKEVKARAKLLMPKGAVPFYDAYKTNCVQFPSRFLSWFKIENSGDFEAEAQ